jgi:DNA-binding MarR family transcriptional regulator
MLEDPMNFDRTRAAGVLAGELARLYGAELQRRLAPLGLTAAQFMVLSELWAEDGQTQRQLTARLGVEQATMANTLARMERDRLIERTPHPGDRRAQIVALSDAARALRAEAIDAAAEVNRSVLEGLPVAERELFLSMLGRIVSAMRAPAADPQT